MSDLERTNYFRRLRDVIDETFNLSEIKTLCFDLPGVDYEHLAGENENKLIKIQSLISYLARRGRLHELRQLLIERRPHIEWPEIPDDEQILIERRPHIEWPEIPDDEQTRADLEILEPALLSQDSLLIAGLVTTIAIVCCGYSWGYSTWSDTGYIYFIFVIVFLFVAIFGFVLARQYGSKRAERLSIMLGLLSALPLIIVIVILIVALIASLFFGPNKVTEFLTTLGR